MDIDHQGEATTIELGYGTSNYINCCGSKTGTRTTIDTDISVLTEAMNQYNAANAVLFTKRMVTKSTTKARFPETQVTYCWIYDRSDNIAHTSATCKITTEGYNVEVA